MSSLVCSDSAPRVDEALVRELLREQAPQWRDLPIERLQTQGWCNSTFRLGDDKVVRLPREPGYAQQIVNECHWLPKLAPHSPLAIPRPLFSGTASSSFSLPWAIYDWIDSEIALPDRISNQCEFANDLAQFLRALHRVDTEQAPRPSVENGERGGSLAVYDEQTREAISVLQNELDANAAIAVWQQALSTTWPHSAVWVHGYISVGNLFLRQGKLAAVIDFGNMAVGDPACDLVIAWTIFDEQSRGAFREALAIDDDTWARGRAWAFWKALIIAAKLDESNAYEARDPWKVIDTVLRDHANEI